MPRRKPRSLPANGSSQGELASLLRHKAVWQLLLMLGTYRDDSSQDAIARRISELSPSNPRYQINGVQALALYHLAVAEGQKPVTLQKKAA